KKFFYHPNHTQTTTLVTNEKGEVHARIRLLPYGEVDVEYFADQTGDKDSIASYTGQEKDEATGLMYYNARYYDLSIGRFISPDSIISGDGSEAIHFNRYAYVGNNPTNNTDPTGHMKKYTGYGNTWAVPNAYYNKVISNASSVIKYGVCRGGVGTGFCRVTWASYVKAQTKQANADAAAAQAKADKLAAAAKTAAQKKRAAEAARLAELERLRVAMVRQGNIDKANAFRSTFKSAVHLDMSTKDYASGFSKVYDFRKELERRKKAATRRRGGLGGFIDNATRTLTGGYHGLLGTLTYEYEQFRKKGDELLKSELFWTVVGTVFTAWCTGATGLGLQHVAQWEGLLHR
ncbi:MAG: RHS repeat-associated core domain-containing protein, partial [SAR324 cluster bacterium]|nr:RHS repeat-associated core domain-containing protein [SAR324 cluster bacterium]